MFLETELNKKKVWDVISQNLTSKEKKFSRNKINQLKSTKSNPLIHRKIIPLFIEDENKVQEREEIIHKYDIFDNERKKKYTYEKMNHLFNNLYHEKNKKEKNHYLKSPSAKKYYLISYRNLENKKYPQIYFSKSEKNYFNNNNSKDYYDDNFDSIENEEKIKKNLEDKYIFFNKDENIDKRKIQIEKIFQNKKKKIEYFHNINKIKRFHFKNFITEKNNNNDKNNLIYNTMNKFNTSSFRNIHIKRKHSNSKLSFYNINKKNKNNLSPEINFYVKKILNCFNIK